MNHYIFKPIIVRLINLSLQSLFLIHIFASPILRFKITNQKSDLRMKWLINEFMKVQIKFQVFNHLFLIFKVELLWSHHLIQSIIRLFLIFIILNLIVINYLQLFIHLFTKFILNHLLFILIIRLLFHFCFIWYFIILQLFSFFLELFHLILVFNHFDLLNNKLWLLIYKW